MLANLTSLIWGTPSNEEAKDTTEKSASGDPIEQQTVPEASSQPLKCATPTIRAATPADEEESDWVLVERAVSPSSVLTPDENDDSPMREEVSNETGGQQVAVPQPRNRVAQRAAKLLQAIDVLRPAQKAQRRREERRLKAKHLERSNKVREVASAGNKRSRRCDMMTPAKFSRAVNNRKC
ncbi:hypothetical protein C7M84_013716 [Penaeus vannamei]|uniref:Uncharacterized protein n=2 Tax=Penaeus vannamei TaxID=6689 RepID=A0A3R7LYT0_PENVA|nr:uncharacterized protein LOC113816540 isoform X2 [Penaeus vannamei]ROT68179.1 hypothetical protein C7M84_013716 [Penaeus vannamei]